MEYRLIFLMNYMAMIGRIRSGRLQLNASKSAGSVSGDTYYVVERLMRRMHLPDICRVISDAVPGSACMPQ